MTGQHSIRPAAPAVGAALPTTTSVPRRYPAARPHLWRLPLFTGPAWAWCLLRLLNPGA